MSMDLAGRNICVLDLETLKSADDCRHCGQSEAQHMIDADPPTCPYPSDYKPIGWECKLDLGLSIGCYWDYQDMALYWFDAQTLEDLVRLFVDRKPLLVSFNGIQFDFPLMRAILRNRYESLNPMCNLFKHFCCTPSYDILAEIWKADPARKFEKGLNSLDAISQANGYGAKEMDVATAPRLWAQGRYAEVIGYNVSDVLKTRRLFEQIVETGQILRGDNQPITLAQPAL